METKYELRETELRLLRGAVVNGLNESNERLDKVFSEEGKSVALKDSDSQGKRIIS